MDSPKDPVKLAAGIVEQTYKLAGQPKYLNPKSGQIFRITEFDETDLMWKTDSKAWLTKYKGFTIEKGIIKNRVGNPPKKRPSTPKGTNPKLRSV